MKCARSKPSQVDFFRESGVVKEQSKSHLIRMVACVQEEVCDDATENLENDEKQKRNENNNSYLVKHKCYP